MGIIDNAAVLFLSSYKTNTHMKFTVFKPKHIFVSVSIISKFHVTKNDVNMMCDHVRRTIVLENKDVRKITNI